MQASRRWLGKRSRWELASDHRQVLAHALSWLLQRRQGSLCLVQAAGPRQNRAEVGQEEEQEEEEYLLLRATAAPCLALLTCWGSHSPARSQRIHSIHERKCKLVGAREIKKCSQNQQEELTNPVCGGSLALLGMG